MFTVVVNRKCCKLNFTKISYHVSNIYRLQINFSPYRNPLTADIPAILLPFKERSIAFFDRENTEKQSEQTYKNKPHTQA